MNNGEFYSGSEYNSVREYAYFPAEVYKKPKEENKSGNESAELGKESTSLQPKIKPKGSAGGAKTLVDKIFNSIKTVATTATVAVTAVVITTTFVTNAPNVDLRSLDCGSNYVEYEMEINDLQEDGQYAIVVSTSNQDDIKVEVDGNGVYKNKLEGLKPNWEYTLSVVQEDSFLGEVVHYETTFQTLKELIPNEPINPPVEVFPTATIGVSTQPANNEWFYAGYYDVQVRDGEYGVNYTIAYEKDGEIFYEAPLEEYSGEIVLSQYSAFDVVVYAEVREEKTEIGRTQFTLPAYTPPQVEIDEVAIVGIDEIRIHFTAVGMTEDGMLDFEIVYGDGTENRVSVTDKDMENGYVTTYMYASDSLTITPCVTDFEDGFERNVLCETKEHVFENTLFVKTMVGLSNQAVTFYPIGITNGATYMHVTSSADPQNPMQVWLEQAVNVYYETEEEITYTIYLVNDENEVLSNTVSVTVDTSVTIPEVEYEFFYVNPGEVGLTYNDDGTINVYIYTGFVCADESVYYQVTIGGVRYAFRDEVARVENLPDTTHTLVYDVCVDIDGVAYSIYNVAPSGTINELTIEYSIEGTITENALRLRFYSADIYYVDMSYLRMVTSSGEEKILTETDFVYNEENDCYDVHVEFNSSFDSVTLYVMANPNYLGVSDIQDYAGNIRKLYEVTITV